MQRFATCSSEDRLVILTYSTASDATRRLAHSMDIVDAIQRPCAVSDRLERRMSMRSRRGSKTSPNTDTPFEHDDHAELEAKSAPAPSPLPVTAGVLLSSHTPGDSEHDSDLEDSDSGPLSALRCKSHSALADTSVARAARPSQASQKPKRVSISQACDTDFGEGSARTTDTSMQHVDSDSVASSVAHSNGPVVAVRANFKKSAKVTPIGHGDLVPGEKDNRSDGGSQMSRSSIAMFHKALSKGSAKEERSLLVLRQLLVIIVVLVSAMSIATMEISKDVIADSISRLHAQDLDGDRLKLQEVCTQICISFF